MTRNGAASQGATSHLVGRKRKQVLFISSTLFIMLLWRSRKDIAGAALPQGYGALAMTHSGEGVTTLTVKETSL